MDHHRPSIHLILLQAEWFDTVVALPQLRAALEKDTATIISALSTDLDIQAAWIVNSRDSQAACVEGISQQPVDLVVLAFQVWAEDWYLEPLVKAIGAQPLVVWCFQPSAHPPLPASFLDVLRYSGAVGTFEGMGTLRNLGRSYTFAIGAPDSPQLIAQLVAEAKAGQVVRTLRQSRIGILPSHNEQMQSNFVDGTRLHQELGPQVVSITVDDLVRAAKDVSQTELVAFISQLRRLPVRNVSDKTFTKAARSSLGLIHLGMKHHLDALTLNDIDVELHLQLGLRPSFLPLDGLDQGTTIFGLEGDLGAATAMIVLNRLTQSPVFFTEFWFWDESKNLMVGGHAGIQDPRIAAPDSLFISHDYEYCQTDKTEGAYFQFICKPGKITLLQLRATPNGWQAITSGGEVIDHPAWIEGYPHAIIRPNGNVLDFFRQAAEVGTTQHWVMVYGEVMPAIKAWCRMQNIPLKEIH